MTCEYSREPLWSTISLTKTRPPQLLRYPPSGQKTYLANPCVERESGW